MSQTILPEEIQLLLKQQEEINKKLEGWKKAQDEKKNLEELVVSLKRKRCFSNIKCLPLPKKLAHCWHNIEVIQQREQKLNKERTDVKDTCIQQIEEYLK